MGSGGISGRPNGVGIPTGQRTTVVTDAPRRVTDMVESKEYAVRWVDDENVVHREIMHCIGGVWHRAPNGENYAASLRALNADSWLVKQLNERAASSSTASIPKEDTVEIIPTEGATGVGV